MSRDEIQSAKKRLPLLKPGWELSGDTSAEKTRPGEYMSAGKGQYTSLKLSFKHDGFQYHQLAREGDFAIYSQRWIRPDGSLSENVCYEVIRIQLHEAHTFPDGKSYPRREGYPTSASWGDEGWTLTDKDAAFEKLRALKRAQ